MVAIKPLTIEQAWFDEHQHKRVIRFIAKGDFFESGEQFVTPATSRLGKVLTLLIRRAEGMEKAIKEHRNLSPEEQYRRSLRVRNSVTPNTLADWGVLPAPEEPVSDEEFQVMKKIRRAAIEGERRA